MRVSNENLFSPNMTHFRQNCSEMCANSDNCFLNNLDQSYEVRAPIASILAECPNEGIRTNYLELY